jgi:tripartite-type tricarboxylate transporter receptor subunit TctC
MVPKTLSVKEFIMAKHGDRIQYIPLFLLALVVGFASPATFVGAASKYPTQYVEVVVPYSPGGPADVMSRIVADIAPKFLGQSMVITNKTGAGGSVAAADVIASRPDGYKLMTAANSFFATTVKTQKIPFNPNDLVPVANFIEDRIGLAVRGDSPWKTLGDLIEYGKKNPGAIRWAHTGKGNALHSIGLILFRKAGIETIDIPYKGVPETASALLGGHIDALSGPYGSVQEHVRSGKIKYLVVYSDRRYSDLPNVPCADELGFSQAANLAVLFGMYIHKDTPRDIQATLYDAFKKTSETQEFKKRIQSIGEEPRFGGPDFVRQAIKNAETVGVPLLKELGLYLNP